MASKFGLAGGIPERRVRPIWDAIDTRQFKNALKQVTTLLGKYPNSPYVLALKALISERMGKPEEALAICLNAKEFLYSDHSALMDDLTLSTLQIVFERLDHLDLATSCYEHACGKFPNNLDLMMGLFNCYVREYSFVRQQQTAIKMYKLAGEERFLLWAVCSIQLQVLCGNGDNKLLLLAEGLIKKHVTVHSLHEPEALIVYISILEQQEKYGDALEILSGNLGSLLMVEVDKLRIQGRLLARSGDYDSAASVYQKILELCPDDWECFQHYLGCLLEDDKSMSNASIMDNLRNSDPQSLPLPDELFDSRIARASSFAQKLLEDTTDQLIRGPHLANLEIERRKQLYGKGDNGKLVESLLEYFSRFGHLNCFTSDIEEFLLVLSLDKRNEFLEGLMKTFLSVSPMPVKALGQSITSFKVQEMMGSTYMLHTDGLQRSYVQMAEMFVNNLSLSKDLDSQESMHGEELLVLSCNGLVQLYWRTGNLGYILEAIVLLEFGLAIRKFVWQYKILLVHLYSYLGVASLAYERYKSLEVKNILMETVSHHIFPQMLVSPLWKESNSLLRDYLKFMDDHFRESADLTFLAYRHRNYSKVIEFVQFKQSLQHSNQYLIAKIDASMLKLKQNSDNLREEEIILENINCGVDFLDLSNEIESKSLTFNEDLQARPWWTPTSGKNYLLGPFEEISYFPRDNWVKEKERDAYSIIGRKSLVPRLIYLSIKTTSPSVKESIEANGGCLSDPKISSELQSLLERYAKILGHSLPDAIQLVGEVSQGLKTCEVFDSAMVDWLNFAVFYNAWKLNSKECVVQSGEGSESGGFLIDKLLQKCILKRIETLDSSIGFPGSDFPLLVQLITEPFTWHSLILQSCTRASAPSGKKKKKSGPTDTARSPLSIAYRESLQLLIETLEEVMKWLRGKINKLEEENMDELLSCLLNKGDESGPGKIFQVLENAVSCASNEELGDRIFEAVKCWSSVDVVRKLVDGQRNVSLSLLSICENKHKALQTLKKQISQA